MKTPMRILVLGLFFLASVGAAFGTARYGRRLLAPTQKRVRPSAADTAGPAAGAYLVAYVLVSSHCGACRDPQTKQALRDLRAALRARADSSFVAVSLIGVGVDQDLAEGMQYMNSIGASFDEVDVGGVWLNQVMTNLVWREASGRAAVPQVVLVKRTIDTRNYPDDIRIPADSVLASIGGRDSLVRWVSSGAALNGRIPAGR